MAVPPFDLKGNQYDLSTYVGRVRHFWGLVNPVTSLTHTAERLAADRALLASWAAGDRTTPDAALWDAKRRVDAVVHPDKQEIIPTPFRMSMFMPVNLPITAGMLLSPPGAAQLFWQFVNQSYNAGFNYFNASGKGPADMTQVMASYGVATATAVGAAHVLGGVVTRLNASFTGKPTLRIKLLTAGLPWLSVATAGSANVLAMRYKDAVDGVELVDADGVSYGKSVTAGRTALAQIVATRVALPVPILLLPPFVLEALRGTKSLGGAMARSAAVARSVELAVIAVFLQCALPAAIALFPQQASVAARDLEPQFHGRAAPGGAIVERFYFNKGV